MATSNQRELRWSEDRTPWFLLYRAHISFDVDDVYCGADFIMVRLADKTWPRWMVIWNVYGGVNGQLRSHRYGRLERRPKWADFRATSRANLKLQPWLSKVIDLAASSQMSR